MASEKAMELSKTLMVLYTQGTGITIKNGALEKLHTKMEIVMRGILNMIFTMEKESKKLVLRDTRVTIHKESLKLCQKRYFIMGIRTKAILRVGSWMEKDFISLQMEIHIKGNLRTINSMAWDPDLSTETNMLVNLFRAI